jgi:putative phosphoribosyl transferase
MKFRNREDAAFRLAQLLKRRTLHDPLVLAVPRGGVVAGAVLARELGAALDVILARKLRAPGQPELALGAVAETGEVYLDSTAEALTSSLEEYLPAECRLQLQVIARQKRLFRGTRPPVPVTPGRSVIVTDDGIATGSTVIAALRVVKAQRPGNVIVAVPVGAPDRLDQVGQCCDEVLCLHRPEAFWAIGQFYDDFTQVQDVQVARLLRDFASVAPTAKARVPR